MRLLRRISYHQMSFCITNSLDTIMKKFLFYRISLIPRLHGICYDEKTYYIIFLHLNEIYVFIIMEYIFRENVFFLINCWCAHNNVVYCIWIWLTIRRMNCYFLSIPLEWRKPQKHKNENYFHLCSEMLTTLGVRMSRVCVVFWRQLDNPISFHTFQICFNDKMRNEVY